MPVIHVHTSHELSLAQRSALKTHFGQSISAVPGKSEEWLMCIFDNGPMYFAGDDTKPSAYVEVNVFGDSVPRANWEQLTKSIMAGFAAETDIPNDRTYIRYTATKDWGWNGSNF